MAEGFDGVHVGGLAGGIDAKDQSDAKRNEQGQRNRPEGDPGLEVVNDRWQEPG